MIYIANTTKQHWHHCFRLPETNKSVMMEIPSGHQVEVVESKHWTKEQIDSFIANLERFGARAAVDLNGKLDKFPGLLYSTTRPLTEDQIHHGHDAVVEAQEKRSAEEAVRSAKGFDVATRAQGKVRGKRLAKVTEVEVKQDLPPNQKPTGNEVAFSVSVDESAHSDLKIK